MNKRKNTQSEIWTNKMPSKQGLGFFQRARQFVTDKISFIAENIASFIGVKILSGFNSLFNTRPIMRVDNNEANKKRAERLTRRQEQEQEDYSDDFNNLFNENVITYHNKYITDVFNEAKDLLDFNYVITFQGKVYIDGEAHKEIFPTGFMYNSNQLENWINALEDLYDLNNWILTGEIIIHEINKKLKIVNRSRRCMGINSLFTINEYNGIYPLVIFVSSNVTSVLWEKRYLLMTKLKIDLIDSY